MMFICVFRFLTNTKCTSWQCAARGLFFVLSNLLFAPFLLFPPITSFLWSLKRLFFVRGLLLYHASSPQMLPIDMLQFYVVSVSCYCEWYCYCILAQQQYQVSFFSCGDRGHNCLGFVFLCHLVTASRIRIQSSCV